MIWIVKGVLVIVLAYIFYQDIKDNMISWPLIILVGVCGAILFVKSTMTELFLISVGMNIAYVSIILSILYLYARIKLKMKFTETVALGEIIAYYALAFCFATVSFVVLIIFAFIFSLIIDLVLNKKFSPKRHVPVVGYISLFFLFAYLGYWSGIFNSIYFI